jgi:hypothetical protein
VNVQQACDPDNPVYSAPMIRLALLLVAVAGLLVSGCKTTDYGAREFIPGKGWKPTRS